MIYISATNKKWNDMKTNLISLAVLASTLILSNITHANENTQKNTSLKQFTIGAGTYATTINIDSRYGDESLDSSGLNISGSYAFSDNFSIRAGYYSLENDDFSDIESSGIDLVAYYGTGLATQGFKAYIGGGFFTDTWEAENESEDFSGLQLNGGFGYNWEVVVIDLIVGLRAADDYADVIEDAGGEGEVTALSVSLLLSARF
jgi:hypothetical protein